MDKVAVTAMHEHSAYASVGARHVWADGCQFVTDEERFLKGERFAFVINGSATIAGTVRWVVRDRVGFAFDVPIADEIRRALLARMQHCKRIELFQA